MTPFKPKRTFESVVRELVNGLEDGSIVLNEESAAVPPEKPMVDCLFRSGSLGIRMNTRRTPSRTPRRLKFAGEWVIVDLDLH